MGVPAHGLVHEILGDVEVLGQLPQLGAAGGHRLVQLLRRQGALHRPALPCRFYPLRGESVSGAFLCCNGGYGGILGEKGCGWMNEINPMRDLPMGFGMALARNPEAMNRFAMLSPEEQSRIVDGTHNVYSKQEMVAYVNKIGNGQG